MSVIGGTLGPFSGTNFDIAGGIPTIPTASVLNIKDIITNVVGWGAVSTINFTDPRFRGPLIVKNGNGNEVSFKSGGNIYVPGACNLYGQDAVIFINFQGLWYPVSLYH